MQTRTLSAFLIALRMLIHTSSAICYVTMAPATVSASLLRQAEHAADNVIELRSFAGSGAASVLGLQQDHEFKDHDGILSCVKFARIHSLLPHTLEDSSQKYLFKVR